jgi:enterochelin esterase-like enzyme
MNHSEYLKRTILKEKIASEHLHEERGIRIYLPPGFNELISYPIIYAQDGQDIFMFGRIATILNFLILEEGLQPVIVVGVNVSKESRTSEYATSGARNEAYKQFFVHELVPYIEQRYPPIQSGIKRLLVGDSLGGTVSLDLSLDNPELFPKILSLSGAFLEPTTNRLESFADLSWLHIWMLIGKSEEKVETSRGVFNFLEWNRKTRTVLEKKKAIVTYVEKDGEHTWGFWQKELSDGLTHFFA